MSIAASWNAYIDARIKHAKTDEERRKLSTLYERDEEDVEKGRNK